MTQPPLTPLSTADEARCRKLDRIADAIVLGVTVLFIVGTTVFILVRS